MSTEYRNAGATMFMTNKLQTSMQGLKLKNDFDFDGLKVMLGLDSSTRTWEGEKFSTNATTNLINPASISVSLTPTTTRNKAIFAKLEQTFGSFDLELGARYDSTTINPDASTMQDNDYNALNANIITTFNMTKENKVFLGFGQASRVPDARELYIGGTGNQKLDQVTNQEVDFGYELSSNATHFKIKGFYSTLENYIYYNFKSATAVKFENIDATIYGAEVSAAFYPTDAFTIDMGASYKVGEKDTLPTNNTDTNLADIAPLRANLSVSYEYMSDSIASIGVEYSDAWEDFDVDNGEQALDSWTTLNAKVKHAFNKNVDFTLGVNNITDETYARSNTYKDLTLVALTGQDIMLLNEPGRYVYTNLDIKF